ncbi:hypothetical protein [Bartonella gliris]|uniref:hypothetical protein n=1 Tax=Bartonella gliris TaxID=3004109 RepID=UPI00295E80CB|nr:hypothetical protein [Bartonella gliris]
MFYSPSSLGERGEGSRTKGGFAGGKRRRGRCFEGSICGGMRVGRGVLGGPWGGVLVWMFFWGCCCWGCVWGRCFEGSICGGMRVGRGVLGGPWGGVLVGMLWREVALLKRWQMRSFFPISLHYR